jgi:hypothetical protein
MPAGQQMKLRALRDHVEAHDAVRQAHHMPGMIGPAAMGRMVDAGGSGRAGLIYSPRFYYLLIVRILLQIQCNLLNSQLLHPQPHLLQYF